MSDQQAFQFHHFKNQALFKTAMTHSSYFNEHKEDCASDNERLEFLGDAVLEHISSIFLYRRFPTMREGEMTKTRAALVCESSLALRAKAIGLPSFLLLGIGEEKNGGRDKNSILSDALEALVAAVYLDSDFSVTKAFVEDLILLPLMEEELIRDEKTFLQEVLQAEGIHPVYDIHEQADQAEDRRFRADVIIKGKTVLASGFGRTKKSASMAAAHAALNALRNGKE